MMPYCQTLIIGAGPAGLTAAYELANSGASVVVIERDPRYVGGISRTVEHRGYRFDIGGHRFFSKSEEIEALWTEILGDEMLQRPRSSRIYYDGKLFDYPLKPFDALGKLGPIEAARCVLSYLKARAFPQRPATNFEQWVVNNFGRRLFEIFFRTYTEKVWGMDCAEISADWAAQRIKGLNLFRAVVSGLGLGKTRKRSEVIKTQISSFRYPRLGPGQMWERARDLIVERGGEVRMNTTITGLRQNGGDGLWTAQLSTGETITAEHVISSAPMPELVRLIGADSDHVVDVASKALRFRDFVVVALIVAGEERFSDNWIYVHDPRVRVGRIQNFKSWSPHMVPDPATACYGMEYFCHQTDGFWNMSDRELVAMARREIAELGLAVADDVVEGVVVRQPKAYPVYDDDYRRNVQVIRDALNERFTNLHLVGRNGMHKYNNQDHAMMTALLTARNILAGREIHDPWDVNEDAEYHEGGEATAQRVSERLVPRRAA
ncbi:MAG TPA: NAD(P)/FAD-dependent oxidoreductase [Devosiaceae bacterium]